jgi:putative ABC transport system permease protein
MSRIPLWALAILSLSIVNAVVASIQTRRVEIGRMRAIGLSRSQLLRLVCVEGILIGVAVCLLAWRSASNPAGAFTGYSRSSMLFGALPITFHLPWTHLAQANLHALGLALAAALVPAWMISRTEPAKLLHPEGD